MKLNKCLALILVFAMLSALIACGSDAKRDEPTTETPTTEAPTTEAPTTEEPTTEEPTTETAAGEEVMAVRGETDGNTYVNSTLGYTVTLGSEWTVADEAGLAQMAGLAADIINSETAQEMVENGQTLVDFYAAKGGGFSTLNITITANTVGALSTLSEEALLNMTIAQNKPILEASGFENLNMEIAPITFAGEARQCIALTATVNGMPIYEYLMMLVTEPCIYTITACSYNEDTAADYLALFTTIEDAATKNPTELSIDSDIVGTWMYAMPCAEMMEMALATTGFECDVADDTVLNMTLTFNADGTCIAKAEEESAKAMLDEMLRAMSTIMGDLLYAEFEKQQGWDKATTDAQLTAQGLTIESLIEQSLAQIDTSSIDFSTTLESEAYYIVEGDAYYSAPTMEDLLAGKYTESMQFVIDGDQMQFLSSEIFDEDAASLKDLVDFPITLTRQ